MKNVTRLLAIETSSPQLSIVLGDATEVVARYSGEQNGRHAEQLFEGIDALFKKSRWPIKTLTGIAVSIGPGSFTGIRIGLAAARSLGQFLNIPVVGISSLETLAWQESAGNPGVFHPEIDALQGRIFTAIYERARSGAWKTRRKPLYELAPLPAGRHAPTRAAPRADALLDLARPRLAKAKRDSYKKVLPLYLREAAAVERLKGLRRDR